MRQSRDIRTWTTPDELLQAVVGRKIQSVQKNKRRYGQKYTKEKKYVDCTNTLDIETTNTDTDGFLYAIQFCIDGECCVLRYVEDFIYTINELVEEWHVTENNRLVLYVHNLGYEFMYLSQYLAAVWGIDKALYTGSRKPLYIAFDNGVELRDSLKLFQKSLAKATKGCKHEKLVGDLDYTVYRTPDTELTQQEFDYCVNDVLGLYEAIERLKAEHNYNQATIPYTNTGMVTDAVNNEIRGDRKCAKAMQSLKLNKRQMYLAYSAMAGGDTHGARWKAGRTFYNCNSYDFKSAHPSQQLLWKFPAGQPIDLPDNLEETDMQGLIDSEYGWVGKLYIKSPVIRSECPDPVISVSKCVDVIGLNGVDNGRLLAADAVMVYCDSNDYQRIKEAYLYDEVILAEGFAFSLEYLPDSFGNAIFEKFRIKETMKGTPEYMFSKICVNTIFGACAQKSIRDTYTVEPTREEIKTCTTNWKKNLASKTDKQVVASQDKKFPFLWGLWTASLTRLKLWRLLKIVGWENVIYWDTDSCKFEGAKIPAVETYNDEVRKQCELRHRVVEKSTGNVYVGIAEDEHPQAEYGYKEFRFLHAKCYAARDYEGNLESTIAGVGKNQGVAALKDNINNLNDMLVIDDAGGMMLAYHDAPLCKRTGFARPTVTASWIVMTPRRYEVKANPDILEKDFSVETLG